MNRRTQRPHPIIRLFLRLLSVLAALLAAAAVLLPLAAARIIGQETLDAYAQASLSAALERPVALKEGVRLTVLPFGLRTGEVVVSNSPGFGDGPLMTISSAAIELDPGALLARRVRVDSVSLAGASLSLVRDAEGRANWSSALAQGQALPEAPGGWKAEYLPTGLTLENARLAFSDARTGLSLEVSALTLKTSPSRPFDFSLSCKVALAPWGLSGELHAKGLGSYGPDGGHIFVKDSRAAGYFDLPAKPGLQRERVAFSGKVTLHGEAGAFEVADMVLDGLGAKVTGQVNAAGLYEPTPYLHLALAAKGSRQGAWTRLLNLPPEPARPAATRPELRRPEEPGEVEAELTFGSTPKGWIVPKAVLRDGAGKLSGTARNADGELAFDVDASGLDLTRWLSARLPFACGLGPSPRTVQGRLSGRDLTAGPLDLARVELAANGRDGQARIYPFTVRTAHALATADLRVTPDRAASAFSGTARIQAISEAPGTHPPMPLASLTLAGNSGPEGLAGRLALEASEPGKDWSPPWLSDDFLKAWSVVGGGSLACSFELPAARPGTWKLAGIDVRTRQSRITGTGEGGAGKTVLDLQADLLDLDRLRLLATVLAKDAQGCCPWPLEARLAAKRLAVGQASVDDLALSLEASPEFLRLSNLSGSAFGGRFQGGLDLEDKAGRRALSGALSVSGLQSAQVSALRPDLPKLGGLLDGRLSFEGSAKDGTPLWQSLNAQADLRLGRGSLAFPPGPAGSQPWSFAKASGLFKVAVKKPAASPDGKPAREAALAEVLGTVKAEAGGMVRSSRLEIKGQAGLDASGAPLWFRQPKAEGELVLEPPFAARGRTALATWNGRFEADFEKETFAFPALELNLAGIPGRAALAGRPGKESLELSGSLDLPEFNPRLAAQHLGYTLPANAEANVWRRARFSAALGGSLREIRLERIQASLDDSAITGHALVSGQANRLDLSVTTLDLDRLAPAPHPTDPAKRLEEPLPLAELRELSLDARIRFGWLKKDRLIFENALAEFSAQGGRFQLRQTAPNFYGGPYALDIRGDARGQELKARMELTLTGFQPGPLLLDLAGTNSLSRGRGSFTVKVDTQGATDRQLRRRATGAAAFEVLDGFLGIKDVPARQPAPPMSLTTDRDAAPPAVANATSHASDGVAFSRLGASFTVREGLAVTRDFSLAGSALSARGDGWVNLDEERIDLSLLAKVPDVAEVPVRISGPLYDPRLDIDKSKVLGDAVVNIFKGIFSIPGSVLMQLRRVF